MDFRERFNDPQEQLLVTIESFLARVWTALPGIVQSFDAGALTCTVQPAIQGTVRDKDGNISNANMPMLVDVPVVYPHGGGYSMTYPVKAGDECLVVFSSRCIDGWWQLGDTQRPLDVRKHDLSDGFAIVGPYSQKQKIQNVSTTTVQLRSDDGKNFFELDNEKQKARAVVGQTEWDIDNSQGTISCTAATQINLNAPIVQCSGQLNAKGDVQSLSGTSALVSLTEHYHVFVDSHGDTGNTYAPFPGS